MQVLNCCDHPNHKANDMSIQPTKPRSTCITAILIVALFSATALACSVPVFRYAIEHWRPDAYRVFVYHDQDLSSDDQQLLDRIKREAKAGANIQVEAIDLRKPIEPIDKSRWESRSDKSLPQMIVQLPAGIGGGEAPVAASNWNETEVNRLINSPQRTDIGQRLVAGEVVWVFLESEDSQENDRLYQLLTEQLAIQQETLELPEIDDADLSELSADPDSLEIKFSTLRVSRSDVAEKWFIEMLLSIEPDLRDEELVNQAMVFPVFGRGRALYALVGEGINVDMIQQAATFLTGACQCTVKAENPGVDLLIPMQWDNLIKVTEPIEVSLPLVGLGGGLTMADKTQTPSSSNTEPDSKLQSSPVPNATIDTAQSSEIAEQPRTAIGEDVRSSQADLTSIDQRSTGFGLWLPMLVLLAIGSVVGLLGVSILRR